MIARGLTLGVVCLLSLGAAHASAGPQDPQQNRRSTVARHVIARCRMLACPRRPAFLPTTLIVGWLTALAALATLAAFFPTELGEKADPFLPAPAGIRPEWYFMFMFQTLKYLPAHVLGVEGELVGIVGFGLAGLLLVLVPFLDRGTGRARAITLGGLFLIAYMLALTALGYLAPRPSERSLRHQWADRRLAGRSITSRASPGSIAGT